MIVYRQREFNEPGKLDSIKQKVGNWVRSHRPPIGRSLGVTGLGKVLDPSKIKSDTTAISTTPKLASSIFGFPKLNQNK